MLDAELLCRFCVDGKREFCRLLDRELATLGLRQLGARSRGDGRVPNGF
jgi:hypothetical protein